jgi:hypothetical protein
MPEQYPEPILHETFAALNFSTEFLAATRSLHYYRPADLLQVPVDIMEKLSGFSQTLLFEFVRFLEAHRLADYLIED